MRTTPTDHTPRRARARADEDYDEGEHGNLGDPGEGRPGEAGDYEKDEDAPERDWHRER